MNTVSAEVRMGNQIAQQFAHLPQSEAVAAIAQHIVTFWDPRMRRHLEALVAAGDDTLDPLLVDATGRLVSRSTVDRPGET